MSMLSTELLQEKVKHGRVEDKLCQDIFASHLIMNDGSDSDECEDLPSLVCHSNGTSGAADLNTQHIAEV